MHIPDGFIAPQVTVPAYGVAGVLWATGIDRLRRTLEPEAVPRLAVATAVAYALMLVAIPLPGGTTAHITGVGMMAALFGAWQTFLSLSLVFLIQALMLGDGGITALPVNALCVGLGGGLAARGVLALVPWRVPAVFLAGWIGAVVPAVLVALVLGWQPRLAHTADGQPLYFPFSWAMTVPAITLTTRNNSHLPGSLSLQSASLPDRPPPVNTLLRCTISLALRAAARACAASITF